MPSNRNLAWIDFGLGVIAFVFARGLVFLPLLVFPVVLLLLALFLNDNREHPILQKTWWLRFPLVGFGILFAGYLVECLTDDMWPHR